MMPKLRSGLCAHAHDILICETQCGGLHDVARRDSAHRLVRRRAGRRNCGRGDRNADKQRPWPARST